MSTTRVYTVPPLCRCGHRLARHKKPPCGALGCECRRYVAKPMQYEWCATGAESVRHAHGAGPHSIAYGSRLCNPSYRVMQPSYWQRNQKQPRKRCAECVRLARETPRQSRKEPKS